VNQELVRQVWRRAAGRCEYCRLPSAAYPLPFHVDHIVAQQHEGPTSLENLALACLHCNRHKGPNIAGRDPVTGEIVRLFNPRQDPLTEHFAWTGAELGARRAHLAGSRFRCSRSMIRTFSPSGKHSSQSGPFPRETPVLW
jgi:hypothetical protein